MDRGTPSGGLSLERFERVTSTQDVVRDWLVHGRPEICVAVADEQTAGRGRLGRRWEAPRGRGLLLSAGLRPTWLPADRAWQISAAAALALLGCAADVLGQEAKRLALKWPNDVIVSDEGRLRKVGGLLAEASPAQHGGHRLDRFVLGLGVNVDWPARRFPPRLAGDMTSLSELAGTSVDREALLADWLVRMVSAYQALADGDFDGGRWAAAQVTTGAWVVVEAGRERVEGRAEGVDPVSGALLVRDAGSGTVRRLGVGEVRSCRIASAAATPEQPVTPL